MYRLQTCNGVRIFLEFAIEIIPQFDKRIDCYKANDEHKHYFDWGHTGYMSEYNTDRCDTHNQKY